MWKNLPYKGCVYFSLILNAVLLAAIFAIRTFLPPVVPLFYGLPSGYEQLTPSLWLMLIPSLGIFVTLMNIGLSNFTSDVFLKRALIISSAFISLLLAIAVIKIVLLVGFF